MTIASEENKKTFDGRSVKQEYIKITVQNQQQKITGTDKHNDVRNLLDKKTEPGSVDAVSGTTCELIRRKMLIQLEQLLQAKKKNEG